MSILKLIGCIVALFISVFITYYLFFKVLPFLFVVGAFAYGIYWIYKKYYGGNDKNKGGE